MGAVSLKKKPAAGNGVTRVLTDVTQLCTVHVPGWLATPGMATDKINAFYDDPIKRACDEHCLWTAEYARSFATDPGLAWRAWRVKAFLRPGFKPGVSEGEPLSPTLVHAVGSGIWSVIQHELAHGQADGLPRLAPDLVRIVLPPFATR